MARQSSSSSPSTSRVTKRTSPKITRARSRTTAVSGSSSGGALARMVEEASLREGREAVIVADAGVESDDGGGVAVRMPDVQTSHEREGKSKGKGKGKMAEVPPQGAGERAVDDQPFRLFDLPTEIRLEIYRACLTRPCKILLSKPEKSAPGPEPEEDEDLLDWDEEQVGETQRYQPGRYGTTRLSAGRSVRPLHVVPSRRRANRTAVRTTLRTLGSTGFGSQAVQAPPNAANSGNMGTAHISLSNSAHPRRTAKQLRDPEGWRPIMEDPLIVTLLRTNKAVYKEARDVLYSENVFTLDLHTSVASLAALHQRSRNRIKHVELEIPTYTEILESFSETVRLSLRYCFGLRKLVVHTPFSLPGADGQGGGGNTGVYANGFDILRWLPQGCAVVLEGTRNVEIDAVVGRHMQLAGVQDKLAYARRQLISNDADTTGV